jgi:hypothetical protein
MFSRHFNINILQLSHQQCIVWLLSFGKRPAIKPAILAVSESEKEWQICVGVLKLALFNVIIK